MVTATDLAPLLRGRVGIDGPDAAGKTTLADALAALTGLPLRDRYALRYQTAYDAYRAAVRPHERADVVV